MLWRLDGVRVTEASLGNGSSVDFLLRLLNVGACGALLLIDSDHVLPHRVEQLFQRVPLFDNLRVRQVLEEPRVQIDEVCRVLKLLNASLEIGKHLLLEFDVVVVAPPGDALGLKQRPCLGEHQQRGLAPPIAFASGAACTGLWCWRWLRGRRVLDLVRWGGHQGPGGLRRVF
eukprot:Amastigsp_a513502_4.p2 type:complete len:173 gc:universal Amastigsp_a513502_4:697-1215(+)